MIVLNTNKWVFLLVEHFRLFSYSVGIAFKEYKLEEPKELGGV